MRYALPILVLFALHAAFLLFGAYSVPHLDSVMHFGGGVALGTLICGLLSRAVRIGWLLPPRRLLLFVLIFSLVTTGAVFWEFFEWTVDTIMGTTMQVSMGDTMKDLLLGQLGAIVYAFAALSPRAHRIPVFQDTVETQSATYRTN